MCILRHSVHDSLNNSCIHGYCCIHDLAVAFVEIDGCLQVFHSPPSIGIWMCLPDAVLDMVIGLLNFTERLTTEGVCRTWRILMRDGCGWKHVIMGTRDMKTYTSLNASLVHTTHLTVGQLWDKHIDNCYRRLSQMTQLSFDALGYQTSTIPWHMMRFVCASEKLRVLDICAEFHNIERILHHIDMRSVKRAVIDDLGYIVPEYLTHVKSGSPITCYLDDSCVVTEVKSLRTQLDAVTPCPNVTELSLRVYHFLSESGFLWLRKLAFRPHDIITFDHDIALTTPEPLPNLEELVMKNVKFGAFHATYPSLCRLSITGNVGNLCDAQSLIDACSSTITKIEFTNVVVELDQDPRTILNPLLTRYTALKDNLDKVPRDTFQLSLSSCVTRP